MKNVFLRCISSLFYVAFVFADLVAQDASLPFPQVAFAPSVTKNAGLDNEVNFIHNGCTFASYPYTNCYTFTIGNTLRVDNNADFFMIRTPRTTINRIDITIQAGNTTNVVAVVAFSTDSINWSSFQELDAYPKNANPSCMLYSLNPPDGMKYFKMMRVGFGGYVPVGAIGVTSIVVFEMHVWSGITYDFDLVENRDVAFTVSPNPAQSDVNITYEVKEKSLNKLIISSILGETMAVLEDAEQQTGTYQLNYDCSNLPKGIYIVTWISGSSCMSKKLIKK